jgi:hypothetical protein
LFAILLWVIRWKFIWICRNVVLNVFYRLACRGRSWAPPPPRVSCSNPWAAWRLADHLGSDAGIKTLRPCHRT